MAIVKGPLHSDLASGQVGDLVFSSWRGRAIVRSPWTGTDPATSAQVSRRTRLSNVAYRWGHTLTEAKRQSWIDFAKSLTFPDRFGDNRTISGYNLFLKRNMNVYPWKSTYIDVPSEGGEKYFVETLECTYYTSPSRVWVRPRYGSLGNNHDYYDYWRAGPYNTQARYPIEGEWRRKQQVLASWYDYTISTGKWYWYRVRAGWDSGVFSSFLFDQVST